MRRRQDVEEKERVKTNKDSLKNLCSLTIDILMKLIKDISANHRVGDIQNNRLLSGMPQFIGIVQDLHLKDLNNIWPETDVRAPWLVWPEII